MAMFRFVGRHQLLVRLVLHLDQLRELNTLFLMRPGATSTRFSEAALLHPRLQLEAKAPTVPMALSA
jgi:hypothetical protein